MISVLKRCDKVRLRNGLIVTITWVDNETNFKYPIEGTREFTDGVVRNYSWTREGKYYSDAVQDGRDIEEVLPCTTEIVQ